MNSDTFYRWDVISYVTGYDYKNFTIQIQERKMYIFIWEISITLLIYFCFYINKLEVVVMWVLNTKSLAGTTDSAHVIGHNNLVN